MSERLVARASSVLERRLSRRGVIASSAVVGSALATSGLDYLLRPGTAYSAVCGSGNTCGSGWTAMCCTINEGINRCPPGSFVGGWWKAADANLCGGKARYYLDCHGRCTKCGCGGGHFCSRRCWNCNPRCADEGTCDQRRVCNNLFRYGQCDRHIDCGGPVWCRAISCTPPWKWENCSSAAATDNRTRSHSAPCLSTWTEIAKRYTRLGSQGSVLGATVRGEVKAANGRVQRYENGRMYWSKQTDAHYLTGGILDRYRDVGETASPLGLPTSDSHELDHRQGRGARFENGAIYNGPTAGAHALWGSFFDKYDTLDRYRGPLGFPETDVKATVDGRGRFARFESGFIFDLPDAQPRALWGPIAEKYDELDREGGRLGFPLTDRLKAADGGKFAHFENGVIYDGLGRVPHALYERRAEKYLDLDANAGPLGYPVSDEELVRNVDDRVGLDVRFENGSITQALGDEPFAVWGPIYDSWAQDGRYAGPLGYPVTDVRQLSETLQRCDFEHGFIEHNESSGQTTRATP